MQPIMDEIEKEYAGQVKIIFYDVWTPEDKPQARLYGIRAIPTQVFLDKDGNEYFRHEGFFPKDELVKVFGKEEFSKGIITWGSSAQVILETVNDLGLQDKVKVCVPELIQPLPEKITRFLKSTEKLLVVEMNYSGQLYRYLRSQIDLPKKTEVYNRVGGRPFSRKELTRPITELAR